MEQEINIEESQIQGNETTREVKGKRRWLPIFLRLFLFSPMKWKSGKFSLSVLHFSWFWIHVAKIVLLTLLTLRIGVCRSIISSLEDNRYIALHHILLRYWDSTYETLPYPPSPGKFAVYDVEDFQRGINYAVEQFYNVDEVATGNFIRTENDSITVYITYYDILEPLFNKSSREISKRNINFAPGRGLSNYTNEGFQTLYRYNITEDLTAVDLQGVLKRVYELDLTFSLHAVQLDEEAQSAVCYQLIGNVTFSDTDQDGQLVVTINTRDYPKPCSELGFLLKEHQECDQRIDLEIAIKTIATITDVIDGIFFIGGFICIVITGFYLNGDLFKEIYKPVDVDEKNLPTREYFWSIPWWLLCSCLADGLTLKGVFGLPHKGHEYDLYLKNLDRSVLYLGSGYLLTLFSSVRFVRISHKFTILFKTVQKSASDVLFFLICVVILFFGFGISTFVVLGPYHVKFQTKSSSFETFFSIINGDEIYATFAILQESYSGDKEKIKMFLKVVIYVYVSLFTVLVFNLLIALFNSAYETVKGSNVSEEERKLLVSALRNYVIKETGSNLSKAVKEFVESGIQNDDPDAELRKILRKYLFLDPDVAELSRERSLFVFMNSNMPNACIEKECCTVSWYLCKSCKLKTTLTELLSK